MQNYFQSRVIPLVFFHLKSKDVLPFFNKRLMFFLQGHRKSIFVYSLQKKNPQRENTVQIEIGGISRKSHAIGWVQSIQSTARPAKRNQSASSSGFDREEEGEEEVKSEGFKDDGGVLDAGAVEEEEAGDEEDDTTSSELVSGWLSGGVQV